MEGGKYEDFVGLYEAIPATVSELAERYCENTILKEVSRHNYLRIARQFERETGVKTLQEVNVDVVFKWRAMIVGRMSGNSWNTYRLHLLIIFRFALKSGWIRSNPFKEVRRIRSPKQKKRVAKLILLKALEALGSSIPPARPGWFWIAAIKVLYYSGMRRRQLAELRWEDIDLEQGIITLRAAGSKSKKEWEIPIVDGCQEALIEMQNRTADAGGDKISGQVFRIQRFNPKFTGDELSPDQISGVFRQISERLGVKLSPHRLRHTMATELAQGVNPDLRSLQYLLGHSDLKTTMEYIEPEIKQVKVAMSKLSLR